MSHGDRYRRASASRVAHCERQPSRSRTPVISIQSTTIISSAARVAKSPLKGFVGGAIAQVRVGEGASPRRPDIAFVLVVALSAWRTTRCVAHTFSISARQVAIMSHARGTPGPSLAVHTRSLWVVAAPVQNVAETDNCRLLYLRHAHEQ